MVCQLAKLKADIEDGDPRELKCSHFLLEGIDHICTIAQQVCLADDGSVAEMIQPPYESIQNRLPVGLSQCDDHDPVVGGEQVRNGVEKIPIRREDCGPALLRHREDARILRPFVSSTSNINDSVSTSGKQRVCCLREVFIKKEGHGAYDS